MPESPPWQLVPNNYIWSEDSKESNYINIVVIIKYYFHYDYGRAP